MCAIYGFLDYGKKISRKLMKTLIRELSVAAECRGTDATGISYIRNEKVVIFKQPKPAHKMRLYFPKETAAVIGHNRLTTQGSEKKNYNNHPFEGKTAQHGFALAHNGILYNDEELRKSYHLPQTQIETDSYAAVQFLELEESLNMESIRNMAEMVEGSFVFTILRDDNTLFLIKGSNPLTIWHFPALGLYLYASTEEILRTALAAARFSMPFEEIPVKSGEIIEIRPDGTLSIGRFTMLEHLRYDSFWEDWMNRLDSEMTDDLEDLMMICGYYGMEREEVEYLRSIGYTADEIEEMLLDEDLFEDTMNEVKTLYQR